MMEVEEVIDLSSKGVAKRPKRGPKTSAGKLAVIFNASTHGIRSPRPVVTAFESESAWRTHRDAIIESLAPKGGMEEALAERVALCTWRLNRVAVYETESIAQGQEGILEEVRKNREHTLRFASLHAREAKGIIAGTTLEELVEDPARLSDYAIEILSPPSVALEGVENARRHYETVLTVFDAAPDTTVSRLDAAWLLEKAPYCAVEYAAFDEEERNGIPEGEGASEDEIREQASDIEEQLWKRIGDVDALTVKELHSQLAWVAEQAGMQDAMGVDGTVAYTPLEGLLEKLHTRVLCNLRKAEEQAQKVEKQLLEKRRARILPSAEDMAKVSRYEAHISRELYRALHELEAMQTRRAGRSAPLGRLDVQS
jgi:hypothetical protein